MSLAHYESDDQGLNFFFSEMHWWAGFAAWLTANGARLGWPDDWVARRAAADNCPSGRSRGVGLFASRDLGAGVELFSIPPDVIIRAPDRFELAEWLVRERLMSGDEFNQDIDDENDDEYSGWVWYVHSLPSDDDAQRQPVGNVYYDAIFEQDSKHDLVVQAFEFMPSWIADHGLESSWLKSLALVSSRLHMVWLRDSFGDWVLEPALVPLADLLNGVSPSSSEDIANVVCETRKSDATFICRTTKSVIAGEELLVSYGDSRATQKTFLETYGFF